MVAFYLAVAASAGGRLKGKPREDRFFGIGCVLVWRYLR
jgi:hypothetical protein